MDFEEDSKESNTEDNDDDDDDNDNDKKNDKKNEIPPIKSDLSVNKQNNTNLKTTNANDNNLETKKNVGETKTMTKAITTETTIAKTSATTTKTNAITMAPEIDIKKVLQNDKKRIAFLKELKSLSTDVTSSTESGDDDNTNTVITSANNNQKIENVQKQKDVNSSTTIENKNPLIKDLNVNMPNSLYLPNEIDITTTLSPRMIRNAHLRVSNKTLEKASSSPTFGNVEKSLAGSSNSSSSSQSPKLEVRKRRASTSLMFTKNMLDYLKKTGKNTSETILTPRTIDTIQNDPEYQKFINETVNKVEEKRLETEKTDSNNDDKEKIIVLRDSTKIKVKSLSQRQSVSVPSSTTTTTTTNSITLTDSLTTPSTTTVIDNSPIVFEKIETISQSTGNAEVVKNVISKDVVKDNSKKDKESQLFQDKVDIYGFKISPSMYFSFVFFLCVYL